MNLLEIQAARALPNEYVRPGVVATCYTSGNSKRVLFMHSGFAPISFDPLTGLFTKLVFRRDPSVYKCGDLLNEFACVRGNDGAWYRADCWHPMPFTVSGTLSLPVHCEKNLLRLRFPDGTVREWGPFVSDSRHATHWMLMRSGHYDI